MYSKIFLFLFITELIGNGVVFAEESVKLFLKDIVVSGTKVGNKQSLKSFVKIESEAGTSIIPELGMNLKIGYTIISLVEANIFLSLQEQEKGLKESYYLLKPFTNITLYTLNPKVSFKLHEGGFMADTQKEVYIETNRGTGGSLHTKFYFSVKRSNDKPEMIVINGKTFLNIDGENIILKSGEGYLDGRVYSSHPDTGYFGYIEKSYGGGYSRIKLLPKEYGQYSSFISRGDSNKIYLPGIGSYGVESYSEGTPIHNQSSDNWVNIHPAVEKKIKEITQWEEMISEALSLNTHFSDFISLKKIKYISLEHLGIQIPVKNIYSDANIGKIFTGKIVNPDKIHDMNIFKTANQGDKVMIINEGNGIVNLANMVSGEVARIDLGEREIRQNKLISLEHFGIQVPIKNFYSDANIGTIFTGKIINPGKIHEMNIFKTANQGDKVMIINEGNGIVNLANMVSGEVARIYLGKRETK